MRSLCLNLFIAVCLLFALGSQAIAGNWVFEASTDSTDGRKGVIVYKSPHFDTTPGAFARFIVLDNNTLRLRLRTTATGPIYLLPDIDFAIPVDGKTDFAGIYYPNKDASRCAAEPELATGCRLTCARTHEDFSQGEEVACTAESDDNLWTDFRADFSPEHTDRILNAYSGLVSINFYAGVNDDNTDYTSWFLNADNLLKHICEQTKAADHACRGEKNVAEASKPEQQAASDEYTSGWVKKSRDEYVHIGDGWDFTIEFDPAQQLFSLYGSLTTGGNQYGELHSVRLVKSEYNGRGGDHTLYFDLLKMDWDYNDEYDEAYTYATCFWPTEGGKISIYSCKVKCSSDEYCLKIGPRTDVSMRTEFPIDLLPNFINALEHFDNILFQFDERWIYEEIGDLPKLLKNREERSLIDILTKDGTIKAYDALKGAELKLPSEITREEACAVLQICDDEKEISTAAAPEPEQKAAVEVEKPACEFSENDMGAFSVYADDEGWHVSMQSQNLISGLAKSKLYISKKTNHSKPEIKILHLTESLIDFEGGEKIRIIFSGENTDYSAQTEIESVESDIYKWAIRISGGEDNYLEKVISDLDERDEVEFAVGYRGSEDTLVESTYSLRGLPVAVSLAKSKYKSLRLDLETDDCTAVSDFYEDDDDW